ncbi:TrkA family protein, partial [Pontibacter ummariensis]
LNLSQQDNTPKKVRVGEDLGYDAKNSLVELYLDSSSQAAGKSIVELQLPKTSLIVLIDRGGKFVTPNGATVLQEKDKLMVMVDNDEELEKVSKVLHG